MSKSPVLPEPVTVPRPLDRIETTSVIIDAWPELDHDQTHAIFLARLPRITTFWRLSGKMVSITWMHPNRLTEADADAIRAEYGTATPEPEPEPVTDEPEADDDEDVGTDEDAAAPEPAREERRPWREFVTCVRDEELWSVDGCGVTLDGVIRAELKALRTSKRGIHHNGEDLAVWEGTRVVAVIRSHRDGEPEVTRL